MTYNLRKCGSCSTEILHGSCARCSRTIRNCPRAIPYRWLKPHSRASLSAIPTLYDLKQRLVGLASSSRDVTSVCDLSS